MIEKLGTHAGAFFLSVEFRYKKDNSVWEVIVVYGPVLESLKPDFLNELRWYLQDIHHPFVIGGDFNMYRFASEKSNELELEVYGSFQFFHF